MSDERSLVHQGDTEIVDGVLVGGREVGPWTPGAVLAGAAVVAGIVIGAAALAARRSAA